MTDTIKEASQPVFSMRAIAIATLGELARDPKTSISARHAVINKLAQIADSADPDAEEAAAQLALFGHSKSRDRRD